MTRKTKAINGIPHIIGPSGEMINDDGVKAAIFVRHYSSVIAIDAFPVTAESFPITHERVGQILLGLRTQSVPG